MSGGGAGSGAGAEAGELTPPSESLLMEFRALNQFLHLSPVGVLRARLDGQIVMMNPMAANLLTPCLLSLDAFNLYLLGEGVGEQLRREVAAFAAPMGVVCQDVRLLLPESAAHPLVPVALGLSVLRLSVDPGHVIVLVSDQSELRRLEQGGEADVGA